MAIVNIYSNRRLNKLNIKEITTDNTSGKAIEKSQ